MSKAKAYTDLMEAVSRGDIVAMVAAWLSFRYQSGAMPRERKDVFYKEEAAKTFKINPKDDNLDKGVKKFLSQIKPKTKSKKVVKGTKGVKV